MNKYYFSSAIRCTVPIFFGYIAIGIPLGLMVVDAGYPWWLSLVMSIIMYAGAGEYIGIGLFAAGVPLPAILITELFVNIRHIVYGLSLITKFKKTGAYKPFLIFALTDETYALLTSIDLPKNAQSGPFYATIAFFDYLYWILGSVIGAIAGTLIPISFAGVDFALTALFAVLLIEQIYKTKDSVPVIIGIIVTITAIVISRLGFINAQHILILAFTMGIATLMICKKNKSE